MLGVQPHRSIRQWCSQPPVDRPVAAPANQTTAPVAGDWVAVAADLASPDWLDALEAAGFDPHKPTVWVAEGLLMYLEPGVVDAVLKGAAGGWVL